MNMKCSKSCHLLVIVFWIICVNVIYIYVGAHDPVLTQNQILQICVLYHSQGNAKLP